MKYDKYETVFVSRDSFEFQFISEGPKGKIKKLVQFVPTLEPGIYNLSFGDLLADGGMDEFVTTNNKDRNKILATLAGIVYEFTARHADKLVFFQGSTQARTRLYQMAIAVNLDELSYDLRLLELNSKMICLLSNHLQKQKNTVPFL